MEKIRAFLQRYDGLMEFARYCVVGGLATVADFGVLVLAKNLLGSLRWGLYAATALGFAAGTVVNYSLSIWFVFHSARESGAGKSPRDFLLFTVIGLIGLGLTELGMFVGAEVLGFYYLLVKAVVTALVLLWNYFARKVLIFQRTAVKSGR